MTTKEIEALLTRKYQAGEIEAGLYKTESRFVFLDSVGGKLTFQWFYDVVDIADLH